MCKHPLGSCSQPTILISIIQRFALISTVVVVPSPYRARLHITHSHHQRTVLFEIPIALLSRPSTISFQLAGANQHPGKDSELGCILLPSPLKSSSSSSSLFVPTNSAQQSVKGRKKEKKTARVEKNELLYSHPPGVAAPGQATSSSIHIFPPHSHSVTALPVWNAPSVLLPLIPRQQPH